MAYYTRLPSGKWNVQVYHPSGRRLTKTDALKSVLKAWANETEAAIKRGDWIDPRAGKVTVADWYETWSATRRVQESTALRDASRWRCHVEPQWATWPLSSITYMACEAWVGDMHSRGVSAHTIAQAVRILRGMLDAAVRERIIASNPMSLVKLPTPGKHIDRVVTTAEETRLIAAAEDLGWPDVACLIAFFLGTGLRFGEAAGLYRRNVNLFRREVIAGADTLPKNSRQTKKGAKTEAGTGRPVPLTDELAHRLVVHLASHEADLVFVSRQHTPLHYDNFRDRHWLRVVEAARIPDPAPTMHDLRHTYGTRLAERRVPPHEIAALLGHSRLASTERYLHAGEVRLDRARRALSRPVDGEDQGAREAT